MFYWIITTFFSSLDWIFWKKALDLNKMPSFHFWILWYLWDFIVSFFIIILWYFNLWLLLDYKLILIIIFLVLTWFLKILLNNKIYRNEKMSNLVPYENLDKIFVIIISYFLFSYVSLFSLLITLFIILIIIVFSIDFKNISLPNNFSLIIFVHLINAIKLLIIWYLLLEISNLEYFAIFSLIFFIISLSIIVYKKSLNDFWKWTKEFYAIGFQHQLFELFEI